MPALLEPLHEKTDKRSSKPEPISRLTLLWVTAAFFVVLWGGKKYLASRPKPPEEWEQTESVVKVRAYRVQPQNISSYMERVGTVVARREMNLQFGIVGRIARFSVENGQKVAKGDVIAALDPQEAQLNLDEAHLDFERASTRYHQERTLDSLQYERAKARLEQARLDLDKTVIRAPFDGYLVERQAAPSEVVDGGAVIGKLVDKSRVSVEMELPEDDMRYMAIDGTVRVTVDSVPGKVFEGKIVTVTPFLDGVSRAFMVKVELPENPDGALAPGMSARCAVQRYRKEGAITLPTDCVAEMTEKEAHVFGIVNGRAVAMSLPVVFADHSGRVEVQGLGTSDLVVWQPADGLEGGVSVEVDKIVEPEKK